MLTRPKFKPHLQLATVPEEGIFVLSGGKESLLRGSLYQLVIPQINGCPADEICDRLAGQASAAQVYFTLGQLEKKGYLTESEEDAPCRRCRVVVAATNRPTDRARRLAESSVMVHGLGIHVEPLCDLLDAAGVRVVREAGLPNRELPADKALTVVVVDHYLRPQIEAFNAAAARAAARGCWSSRTAVSSGWVRCSGRERPAAGNV